MAERNLEMVGIIQGVQKILVKWVDVLKSGEALEDLSELLREGFLGELDFSSIESCENWLAIIADWMRPMLVKVYEPRIRLILNPARI